MLSSAVHSPSLTRGLRMLGGERHQLNPQVTHCIIESVAGQIVTSDINGESSFQPSRCWHPRPGCCCDNLGKTPAVRLVEHNCQKRGRVHDHFGSPVSSS